APAGQCGHEASLRRRGRPEHPGSGHRGAAQVLRSCPGGRRMGLHWGCMENEKKSVNFTIVPDDDASIPRVYSNFCAIQNSPFDFTLTFCEMLPIGDREIQQAQATQVVKAPVRARMVVPVQMIPGLIAAL